MDNTQYITRSVSAADMAKALGLKPNRAGFCRCPLHGEKTASLKLYPGDRGWYCFGCHQGGDVIRLVQVCLHCDFKQAVAWISDTFGLVTEKQMSPSERKEMALKREERNRAIDDAKRTDWILTEMKLNQDLIALNAMRDIETYRPTSPDGIWDPRYKEALDRLQLARAESDRLNMEQDDLREKINSGRLLTKQELAEYTGKSIY